MSLNPEHKFRGKAAGWHCGRLAAGAAGLLLCVSAGGAPEPAVTLDANLQALKQEAVELNRDLDSLSQAVSFPLESRVSFYVIDRVGGFLIDQVVVIVN